MKKKLKGDKLRIRIMKRKCKQCYEEFDKEKLGVRIDFGMVLDFCSWKCLGDYAYGMSKEFENSP